MESVVGLIFAATFTISGTSKLVYWREFNEWILSFSILNKLRIAPLIAPTEFAIALMWIAFPVSSVVTVATLSFLISATVFLELARQRGIGCGCFGQPRKVSIVDLGRNVMLTVGCLATFFAIGSANSPPPELAFAVAFAVAATGIIYATTREASN